MKNKKILILSIIAIILMAAIAMVVLYFTTDLFKTEQQLFYKYLAQTQVMDSNFVSQYNAANEKITKNNNSSSAKLEVLTGVQNQETGAVDTQEILTVTSNGLENKIFKQSYRDFTFSSNNPNLLTLKYIKDDNTYGLIADNILAKYLAVENANLKELFSKFGVEDTTQVPDSIPTNYEEILKIDEVTLNQLKTTYGTLIYNNIDSTHFYNVVNEDKTESIGISLTEQEIKDLLILVLETAKNDNTLLGLIINKANLIGINNITVESIQTQLQTYIDELQPKNPSDNPEWDGWKTSGINKYEKIDNTVIKIALVKKNSEIIGIDFETSYTKQTRVFEDLANETYTSTQEIIIDKIEVDFSQDNNIIISIKENNNEISKINLSYSYDNNNININIDMESKQDEENTLAKMQYQINNIQTDNIAQQLTMDIKNNEEENYQINFTNNIELKEDIIISKLTTENSAKLNDMTAEEISQLIVAITARVMDLYGAQLNNL